MVRSFSHSKIMHHKHFFDIIYSFVGCVTCDTSLQLIAGVLNRGEGVPCPMEVRLQSPGTRVVRAPTMNRSLASSNALRFDTDSIPAPVDDGLTRRCRERPGRPPRRG